VLITIDLGSSVIESTYGNRKHVDENPHLPELIEPTLTRGVSIPIQAFAVDRTDVILVCLKNLLESRVISSIAVYLDSPMVSGALVCLGRLLQTPPLRYA
jgi:metallo-beta-lactamase family protein